MEKIDFKDEDVNTEKLLLLVASKVQEIVDWINGQVRGQQ